MIGLDEWFEERADKSGQIFFNINKIHRWKMEKENFNCKNLQFLMDRDMRKIGWFKGLESSFLTNQLKM